LACVAAVATGVVTASVFVRPLACVAKHVDEGVGLGVVVDARIIWHARETELGGFHVHRMSNEMFVVGFENELTLLIWEDILAILEENMQFM